MKQTMLKKKDKDGIIEHLKVALADVKMLVDDVTLDPELSSVDEKTLQKIIDKIDHTLIDVTW